MDVESPEHLERLRNLPEIKTALLRFQVDSPAMEARFERVSKNVLYWPVIENLIWQALLAPRRGSGSIS